MSRCNKKEKERLLGIEPDYLLENKFFEPDYLRFRSDEDNILYIKKNVSYNGRPALWYSYNKINWVEIDVFPFHIDLSKGKYVYFKGDNKSFNTNTSNYISFDSEKEIYCSGDIMTLLGVENFSHDDSYRYCFYRLFYNFTNLLTAPKLTAKILSKGCYSYMFQGCTSLVTAPKLPALDLDEFCYEGMFSGCTSLVNTLELPALYLPNRAYSFMFSQCTSLKVCPEIKAEVLSELSDYGQPHHCDHMFRDCTSLKEAKVPSATTIVGESYQWMFENCTALEIVPKLPGITFTYIPGPEIRGAYLGMFENCTSLKVPPELPATDLTNGNYCYSRMFKNCTALTTAPDLPATTLAPGCYQEMFLNCTALVILSALPAITATSACYRHMFNGCTSLTTAPALPATTLGTYCYENMFKDCTSLTTVPELPATTLALSCYESMFENCTSLTGVSNLPATTFASRCYYGMFSSTSIIPDVTHINFNDQTTIDSGVCRGLFMMTNITYEYLYSILPKDNNDNACLPLVAPYCYDHMFSGCELLTKAPKLPATVLNGRGITECTSCYSYMFSGCTALTAAPELPATNYIAESCYKYMFAGCTNLVTASELPAIYVQNYSYDSMFRNCVSLINPPSDLPCTYSTLSMYSYMFYGCTLLEESPILHVGALGNRCFSHMFEGCSSLKKVTTYYTSFSSYSTEDWLKNVAQSGDFYDLGNANEGIPTGWTRHTSLE